MGFMDPIRFVCMQVIFWKFQVKKNLNTSSCTSWNLLMWAVLRIYKPITPSCISSTHFLCSLRNFWCSCSASQSPIISLRLYRFVAAPQIEFSHQPCPFCLHAVWPSTPTPTAWWNWIVTFRFAWAHIPLPARYNLQKLSPAFSRGQRVILVPEDSISPAPFFLMLTNPPNYEFMHEESVQRTCISHAAELSFVLIIWPFVVTINCKTCM